MSKKHLIMLGVLIVVVVAAGSAYLGTYLNRDDVCTYDYRGRVTFDTHEEYNAFKAEMIQDGIRWHQMDVLSSDPPIVAEFYVEVPYGLELSYGDESLNNYWYMVFLVFIGVVWCPLGAIAWFINEKKDE